MGKLSTFLGILTALLAIGAAVLSFLLFAKRNEFRGRADKLAGCVAEMVDTLEKESGTRVGANVNFEPGDPATKKEEKGSLGWKAYQEAKDEAGTYAAFSSTLSQAVKLAGDINERRNALVDAYAKVAADLSLPEGQLDPNDLKYLKDNPADFNKAVDSVHHLTSAIVSRDDNLIQTYIACGNVIGYNMLENVFREREETVDENGVVTLGDYPSKVPLTEFANKVTQLNTRCNDYAQTIVDGINRTSKHSWQTDPEQILDETEYAGALTSLLNDFDDINQTLVLYEKAKLEIAEQKLKIEELVDELEQTRAELNKARDTIVEQAIKIKNLTGGLSPDQIGGEGPAVEINLNLEGHVVQVNSDWNFIILDLGWKSVKENMHMLVARGDELVGRCQVSKVLKNICIAELLPEGQTSPIQVGDRVIFPKAQPLSAQIKQN